MSRAICGAAIDTVGRSSSTMAISVPATVRPVAMPDTVTVSFNSSIRSFVGVKVNMPVAEDLPAPIVTVNAGTTA